MTTYQATNYSDFQSAVLIYLASEERFFRIEHQHTKNQTQIRAPEQSSGKVFPNSVKIMIADVPYVLPVSAKPVSRKQADVSAKLQELEQASLIKKSSPFFPGTEYESYSITVQGSRHISEYLYALIPIVNDQARIREVLKMVEGFEYAKSWLIDLGPRFKERPLEDLVNELLIGVRKFPAIGINLLLVLGREVQSEKN